MSAGSSILTEYSQPHQFEPLMPGRGLDRLAVLARPVIEAAHRLQGSANESTRRQLCELVRTMNSYYSNRIEGQSTHPIHIDKALRANFSGNADVAKRQRIALAHIEAERAMEGVGATEAQLLGSQYLVLAHANLYGRLSEDDRRTDEGRLVEPGRLRTEDVAVGRHQPPAWVSVPSFLARVDEVYATHWGLDKLLVAMACQHHRMAWVHPFLDGNGRAGRVQLHAAMRSLTGGLWSVNRGLARRRDEYYWRLSEAGAVRQGDLDGRGNLSERTLLNWCEFFIDICSDQVAFMTRMLDLGRLQDRITALITIRSHEGASDYRPQAILPLLHVLAAGPVARGGFIQMTGLAERTGRKVLSQLIADGLLISDGHRAEVRIGFPLNALDVLFPNLYPEAATAVTDE
ncbi:MAG: Fic family protein [Massilia sp.]|nr:Fic family protein [Aquabacterium sp.]